MSALGDLLRSMSHTAPTPAPEVEDRPANLWTPGQPVGYSADFYRIKDLPRREVVSAVDIARDLTYAMRTVGGTMSLKPIQALALHEAKSAGGLLGPMAVGVGKTLVCCLMPVMLEARNTVLMVPPALRTQLMERHYPEYARHWRLPVLSGAKFSHANAAKGVVHVVSYSELSSARGAGRLEEIQPDLVVCDEAHCLKYVSAARTKRFLRYAKPAVRLGKLRCVFVSGTLVSRSITDFAHLAALALRERAPVPLNWPVLQEWAAALDPGPFPSAPGVLSELCNTGEDVRSGFRRRLVDTVGVVATSTSSVAPSLKILSRKVSVPKSVSEALNELRSSWRTPAGEEIDCALSMWMISQQLAAGLFYRRVWPRCEPLELRKEWLESRNEYFREVRTFLNTRAKAGMDSPLLLAKAAAAGTWDSAHYSRWSAVHRLARPATEAVWVDEYLAVDAAEWGSKHKGIIWTSIDAFARKLSDISGLRYYGPGKQNAAEIVRASPDRSIIASEDSHGTGTDGLQNLFSTQLVTTTSSSGKHWTQVLGRLHREGQKADEVECHVYQHTPEARDAFHAAVDNSRFIETILGDPQKLSSSADVAFAF